MKLALLHLLLVLAVLCSLQKAPAPSPIPLYPGSEAVFSARHPIRLAAMLPGDRLEVSLLSKGCFGLFDAYFVLAPDGSGRIRLTGEVRQPSHQPSPVRPRVLAPAEVRGLDNTLALYRATRSEGFCTSQSDIRLVLFDGARVDLIEQYHDGTCRSDDGAGIVYFTSLIAEAFPGAPG